MTEVVLLLQPKYQGAKTPHKTGVYQTKLTESARSKQGRTSLPRVVTIKPPRNFILDFLFTYRKLAQTPGLEELHSGLTRSSN